MDEKICLRSLFRDGTKIMYRGMCVYVQTSQYYAIWCVLMHLYQYVLNDLDVNLRLIIG